MSSVIAGTLAFGSQTRVCLHDVHTHILTTIKMSVALLGAVIFVIIYRLWANCYSTGTALQRGPPEARVKHLFRNKFVTTIV